LYSAYGEAYSQFEESSRHIRSVSLQNVVDITYLFGHKEDLDRGVMEVMWHSLQTHILYFLRELDKSGLSKIIGQVAPNYLGEFSFKNATSFRETEENLLRDLAIPEEAWNLFWEYVDENKGLILSEMRGHTNYSFYEHLYFPLIERFRELPLTSRHLSPFRWGKALLTALGTGLGLIDWAPTVATAGLLTPIAITSTVAACTAVGSAAGIE